MEKLLGWQFFDLKLFNKICIKALKTVNIAGLHPKLYIEY